MPRYQLTLTYFFWSVAFFSALRVLAMEQPEKASVRFRGLSAIRPIEHRGQPPRLGTPFITTLKESIGKYQTSGTRQLAPETTNLWYSTYIRVPEQSASWSMAPDEKIQEAVAYADSYLIEMNHENYPQARNALDALSNSLNSMYDVYEQKDFERIESVIQTLKNHQIIFQHSSINPTRPMQPEFKKKILLSIGNDVEQLKKLVMTPLKEH